MCCAVNDNLDQIQPKCGKNEENSHYKEKCMGVE